MVIEKSIIHCNSWILFSIHMYNVSRQCVSNCIRMWDIVDKNEGDLWTYMNSEWSHSISFKTLVIIIMIV